MKVSLKTSIQTEPATNRSRFSPLTVAGFEVFNVIMSVDLIEVHIFAKQEEDIIKLALFTLFTGTNTEGFLPDY